MDESFAKYYDAINQQQAANNAWSAAQAQKAMDYQTEMSNTAHQREVADLKAAGLNPVLSAGGQGATTGSGHAAVAGSENVSALYGMVSKLMDVQLEQAKAMETSAKAVSGSSGSSNGSSSSSSAQSVHDSPAVNILKDILKRKYGIKPETVDQVIDTLPKSSEDAGKVLEDFANSGSTGGNLFNAKVNYEREKRDQFFKFFDSVKGAFYKVKNFFVKDGFSGSSGKFGNSGSKARSSGRAGKF